MTGAGRLLTFLCGVRASDPPTLGGVALLLIAIALLSAWLPARRAAQVDPLTALRAEWRHVLDSPCRRP